MKTFLRPLALLPLTAFLLRPVLAAESAPATVAGTPERWLTTWCGKCHDDDQLAAGLSFDGLAAGDIAAGQHLADWEAILRMTTHGEMPPRDRPQPAAGDRLAFSRWLQGALDARGAAHPDPGRATLRRLNRVEYANAVRDLLALDVDIAESLPADDSGYGFDNIADVLTVTPTLMERYLAVAGRVSRLAVGRASDRPFTTTYTVPKDGSVLNQGIPSWDERASAALPLDSRGGAAFRYYAPHDGTYEISGWLNANTNNESDRLPETRVSLRVKLAAGSHSVGLAFRRQLALDESVQTLRNNLDYVPMPVRAPAKLPLEFVVDGAPVGETWVPSYHVSPRFSQTNWPRDVLQVDVEGPFDAKHATQTPSQRRIFLCRPMRASDEDACAQRIVRSLARVAWRRPVSDAELAPLMKLYGSARTDEGFDAGIEAAVAGVLVSPRFLFLDESHAAADAPGRPVPLDDHELASRLALFLWSSLPDETLRSIADRGQLRLPGVLERQVDRMLADPKAHALTTQFAGQWLYLRNLQFHRPDVYLFPAFSTRLRDAMREETELFFASVLRENRSVLTFIDSDYTFLNEALAGHYGIDSVKGPAFRRVALPAGSQRGGLLGQASILTVTSYANHTSVVKRGQWILTNLLAAPPPPPPPDIPALKAVVDGRTLSAREQLELHRSQAACASCHSKIDPLGYALEGFDAVGVQRAQDSGRPVDASAVLADGTAFDGLPGLRRVLLDRKDDFTRAFTERMLTYALGRGLVATDMPTVRAIARDTARDDYRIRNVIVGIVRSDAFTLRRTPES